MSSEEHLVENIVCYVEDVGWNEFHDQVTVEDIKKKGLESFSRCGDVEVSLETLAWLFTMARYVDYQSKEWGNI